MMDNNEREVALRKMQEASDQFYCAAVEIGNHPFIEFTGLLNEYIKACQSAHEQGIDFSDCNIHNGTVLPMPSHMIAYVNEKLECIFSGTIAL